MLIEFNDKNVKWLELLIDRASTETEDKSKIEEFKKLREKVSSLNKLPLSIEIKIKDIQGVEETIKELEDISQKYVNLSIIGYVEGYDNLKKEVTTKLQYLSTYKDIFMSEAKYIEDVLKKEVRVTLVEEIKASEGCSFTQANNLVDKDKRYTILRDQVYQVKKVAERTKTKYQFYMQLWQMIFQSVSTATKEKYSTRTNNNT